jgi:pimeloyl-ACP methyl ester carboxylesterase
VAFTDANRQRLYYEDSGGPGLPLVLSHGMLMDHEMFVPQMAALGRRRRVLTWDQRGHGLTVTTPDDFSYWDSADDLRVLLDTLGIGRVVLGGMSQGGFLSLRFALRWPERVLGLVLMDTQAGQEEPEKQQQYHAMADVWITEGPSDVLAEAVASIIIGIGRPESPGWIAKWKARPPAGVRQIFRTLITREDLTDRLAEIEAPALVIHGEQDLAIELWRARMLADRLPRARPLFRVPGAGHAANLTHPDPVNEAIDRFLGELSATL